MTIEEFVNKAIEGGWKLNGYEEYPQRVEFFVAEKNEDGSVKRYNPYWIKIFVTIPNAMSGGTLDHIKEERIEYIILDPKFWEAVGKTDIRVTTELKIWAKSRMLMMIDHLCNGGTIEDFISKL